MKNMKKSLIENLAQYGEYVNRMMRWASPRWNRRLNFMKTAMKQRLVEAMAQYGEYLNRMTRWFG